jgi:hypothetical protein
MVDRFARLPKRFLDGRNVVHRLQDTSGGASLASVGEPLLLKLIVFTVNSRPGDKYRPMPGITRIPAVTAAHSRVP